MRAQTIAIFWVLMATLASMVVIPALAQEVFLPSPDRAVIDDPRKGFPSSRLYWNDALLQSLDSRTLRVQVALPTRFTSLAVAWSVADANLPANQFYFSVKSRTSTGEWSSPVSVEGETAPSENPSGFYWSSLYMTPGGCSHDEVEIVMTIPSSIRVTSLQVMAAEILPVPPSHGGPAAIPSPSTGTETDSKPTIIPRKDWWGNLPPDSLEAHFGPIKIAITHAVVHHTAMTNNPPDPSQEIRSIWNLHVYGNGWSDIGYNFLIDQFGNIYQGRYNPWLDSTDVQGAHATSANVKSVGISVLGNFGPSAGGIPDQHALRSLERLIAWRFDQRGLNPLESASIPTNLGGPRIVPRICGHRDVGTTECPGESLYVLLPATRMNVHTLLAATSINGEEEPQSVALHQNYPNPFNPLTTIRYQIAEFRTVKLSVYDVLGREIEVLVNEREDAGAHEVRFDGSRLPSGVYFYRLQAGDFVQTRRLVLLK